MYIEYGNSASMEHRSQPSPLPREHSARCAAELANEMAQFTAVEAARSASGNKPRSTTTTTKLSRPYGTSDLTSVGRNGTNVFHAR